MQTEILATIGPASQDKMKAMIRAGMSGIRINSSHGSIKEHAQIIRTYRNLTSKGFVVYDIKGPKIRIGDLPRPLPVQAGMQITLRSDLPRPVQSIYTSVDSFKKGIPITYELDQFVKQGDRLFIDDGYVSLKVLSKDQGKIDCEVVYGDQIRSRKGLNHPDTKVPFPYTMPQDIPYIHFAKEYCVDFIADSFTRNREDVEELRSQLKDTTIQIISKIENPEAINAFDSILKTTDAIMIARGDLGIEIEPWQLPELQKQMISKCNSAGKPVITATQMLETMIENPFPSRADVSDVANALYDGTDVVMLSAETSIGKYPVKCIDMMHKIDHYIARTERYQKHKTRHFTLSALAHNNSSFK